MNGSTWIIARPKPSSTAPSARARRPTRGAAGSPPPAPPPRRGSRATHPAARRGRDGDPGDGLRNQPREAYRPRRAWRKRDVMDEPEHLEPREAEAEQHGAGRGGEASDAGSGRPPPPRRLLQREVQCEQPRRDE